VKVVFGLGNPGKRYQRTRHNLGFMIVDRIAALRGAALDRERHRSHVGECRIGAEAVLLVKPQTYVNRSGEALRSLLRYYPLAGEDLIVVHDDLDLPFGRIRIRGRGSAGGHRGILSLLEALGDERFFRVRVGIGRPPEGEDPADYVLRPFAAEEAARLESVVEAGAEAVEALIVEGAERAMEKFNRRN
jgi:PTH1 family peptidyl-tRNA hydrolase